ncbi:MAG: hypothetical protein GY779_06555 [Gammaproteobacteria bacterium]|nr:hypothetical protein [Gammaproteobacteria bacterium]
MLTRLIAGIHKSVTALLLCGLLASMPVAAQRFSADGSRTFHRSSIYLAQGQLESLDSAVARIRGRTGGRVLSAETKRSKGRVVHHIRILTKGKVKRFKVIAKPVSPRR